MADRSVRKSRAASACSRYSEGCQGVLVPTTKITSQHLGPIDSAISLLSDEARTELAKLRREYAITFADKDGGKSVFKCREDCQQGLSKEVNASSTYKFSNKVQGSEHHTIFALNTQLCSDARSSSSPCLS